MVLAQFNTAKRVDTKGKIVPLDMTTPGDNLATDSLVVEPDFNMGVLPLDNITITSYFGPRVHPITGIRSFHSGLDLRANKVHIFAVQNGIITDVGYSKYLGKYVRLVSGTFEFTYGHLEHIYVTLGKVVSMGDIIGKSGDSGRVTAAHLHFGIKLNGRPIDPLPILTLLSDSAISDQGNTR